MTPLRHTVTSKSAQAFWFIAVSDSSGFLSVFEITDALSCAASLKTWKRREKASGWNRWNGPIASDDSFFVQKINFCDLLSRFVSFCFVLQNQKFRDKRKLCFRPKWLFHSKLFSFCGFAILACDGEVLVNITNLYVNTIALRSQRLAI